ncbi:uncharacterized protein LOC104429741 isoform X2 [Eucalyptus grandis]|uniref:uncharacterized protein LOC104429741 isoform X2 n=1 Tax=Eucalyptus grandis TaxID=71139 RepID=UPI00192EA674|nr:uncharacterized protein LOC104429741 isoform X2 [Eucalyptus grandis]
MAKRASASSSSGQPSQPKRPRFAPTDQPWNGSKRNLVLGSCSTEEDAQRVCGEEPEPAKSHSAEYCQSTGNALKDIVHWIHSMENSFQKLKELVELAIIHSPHLGRVGARSIGKNDVRNLRLQFQTKLSDPLFTGRKLRGVGGARISVALIDANTGDVVTSGLESSIKLDVVVLEGDFNKDDEDDWAHEEFENFVVKERQQKGLLLTGDLQVTLNAGVGELGELIFTDNSSWNRSKRFRIGLKKASGYCGNTRIREAKTDAFRVKEHRGESSKKHDIPAFEDEIWRLKMIAKDGKYHRKLSEVGIHKVGDFLLQLFTDPMKLKEILGMSPNSTNWDTLENHAKSCKINWKLYLYYTDGTKKHGVVFNTDHQLIGLIKDRVYCASDGLSADDLEHGDTIVKKALGNKNDVTEFNGETFSPSMQKESSSSIPCKVIEGKIENLTPVQSNLAPRVWAAAGGSEAPLANVGLTAEVLSPGHDGATALALPVQLQNTNSGNAMKLSADESVHLAAQRPLNVLISQGEIHSSRQMDYTVNENGPPSEPPTALILGFQSSSTLSHPQGNYGVEGFQSIDSDDILGNSWPDDPASSEFCLHLPFLPVILGIQKIKKRKGKVEKSTRGEEDREFAKRDGKREPKDGERKTKKNKKKEERRALAMDVSPSQLNCIAQCSVFWLAASRTRALSMRTFGSGLWIRFEDTFFKKWPCHSHPYSFWGVTSSYRDGFVKDTRKGVNAWLKIDKGRVAMGYLRQEDGHGETSQNDVVSQGLI